MVSKFRVLGIKVNFIDGRMELNFVLVNELHLN